MADRARGFGGTGEKITRMEHGIATAAFSSGMGAISATLLTLLRAGDHLVASSFLFSSTTFETFAQLGISSHFRGCFWAANVEAALHRETRIVFVETIANPCNAGRRSRRDRRDLMPIPWHRIRRR